VSTNPSLTNRHKISYDLFIMLYEMFMIFSAFLPYDCLYNLLPLFSTFCLSLTCSYSLIGPYIELFVPSYDSLGSLVKFSLKSLVHLLAILPPSAELCSFLHSVKLLHPYTGKRDATRCSPKHHSMFNYIRFKLNPV